MRERRARADAAPKVHAPCIVLEGARIGEDAVIGAFSFIASSAVIGRGTRIQGHTSVWDGVVLGEDVFVGPAATFTNVKRPRAAFPRDRGHDGRGWDRTFVDDGASIGANATLVAPIRIGRAAMIGAGAVVTNDVPAHALVVGSPARVVGWVCGCGESVARGAQAPARAECRPCGIALARDGAGGLREVG